MKIKFDIKSNFDDFFNSSVLYWEKASTEETHREINYKKALIFLGASIELALLLLVKEKTDHTIIDKKRETISFRKACIFLRERNMIFSHIDNCFFPTKEKEGIPNDDCLSTIKILRDKLLHNHGEIDTSETDNNIAHAILVLNYIMLPLGRVLISEYQKMEWLLKNILSSTEWNDVSPILSKRLMNEIQLHKDNYFDYPSFEFCQICPHCACKGTISILSVKNEKNTFQGQCTICLHHFDIKICKQCNAGFDESVILNLNEEDPENIICENCYDLRFKS